jgi:hypothetical protein
MRLPQFVQISLQVLSIMGEPQRSQYATGFLLGLS